MLLWQQTGPWFNYLQKNCENLQRMSMRIRWSARSTFMVWSCSRGKKTLFHCNFYSGITTLVYPSIFRSNDCRRNRRGIRFQRRNVEKDRRRCTVDPEFRPHHLEFSGEASKYVRGYWRTGDGQQFRAGMGVFGVAPRGGGVKFELFCIQSKEETT